MKKAVYSIISIVLVLSVLLITFSFNTLETITKPDSFIQYKANKINIGAYKANVAQGQKIRIVHNDYTFESVKNVEEMSPNHIGDNFQDFIRIRENVYSGSNGPRYSEGVPITINVKIRETTTTSTGITYYNVTLDSYYINFTFEQFAKNATYVLEYQKYMNENDSSLQRPPKPDYSVNSLGDTFKVVSAFFTYIGDSSEYFFQRLEYYINYVKFYIQDWAILFKPI